MPGTATDVRTVLAISSPDCAIGAMWDRTEPLRLMTTPDRIDGPLLDWRMHPFKQVRRYGRWVNERMRPMKGAVDLWHFSRGRSHSVAA
jgi:hypothetical protein